MSLLSVASSGAGQMRAITKWGAASAAGAAAGPLIGGLLVGLSGWQGLFWIDAGIAAVCIPLTLMKVEESCDPNRSRSIDFAGTLLIAVVLVPLVLATERGRRLGLDVGCDARLLRDLRDRSRAVRGRREAGGCPTRRSRNCCATRCSWGRRWRS